MVETGGVQEMSAVAVYLMDKPFPLTRGVSPAEDDAELIARCREGDATAFREIYRRHRSSIFRIVARMLSNSADQEEVTQEVLLQVFRSLSSFKGTAKLSTWIHRVTMNVVLQHIRYKKSRIRLHFEENVIDRSANLAGSVSTTPEDSAIQKERRSAVERAIGTLSEKKRAALVLHDFEGLPAKEISQIVGAPVLTVRTRIFYARREFYKRLSGEPAFADIPLDEEAKK
ncbi:MAG: sigma-70 family RNA polymerase sigma factor [Deltaproteobacteria bacterium]|nr:sigma-70 family RNA polymerase sigma factor [Deltaproteobacteria bacterium]